MATSERQTCRFTVPRLASAFLLLALSLGSARGANAAAVVPDVLAEGGVEGVHTLYVGAPFMPFERAMPEAVEGSLFQSFEGLLNVTQAFHANGHNDYVPTGRQFVVAIDGGRVSGVLGSVTDAAGRQFAQFAPAGAQPDEAAAAKPCRHFKRLATVVQKYGHMYYHFMQEVLPRVILLREFLDDDTKLLTFGSDHEYKWLEALGVQRDQIEVYRPDELYCVDELIVPTMSEVVTPPKENYELLRTAFRTDARVPSAQRTSVVYCSRDSASERRVSGEAELLDAVRAEFPDEQVVVYTGSETAEETVALFRSARAVVGMHGACLSHAVFADPDAAVVELLFLTNPPLMFWHAAAAIGQRYVLVPLAQSWWLQRDVSVDSQDVLDALYVALDAEPASDCEPGFFLWAATSECLACPAGTYRAAGMAACMPCPAGRTADAQGAGYCATCAAGTFSTDGFSCEACRPGTTTLFPGAGAPGTCQPMGALKAELGRMFDADVLVKKLVSMPGLDAVVDAASAASARPSYTGASLVASLLRAMSPGPAKEEAARGELRRRYLSELFSPKAEARQGYARRMLLPVQLEQQAEQQHTAMHRELLDLMHAIQPLGA
ncbi:hypothetical protein FOA52_013859 [Chlamydomonas sp. UWO 241]|nr:hypothetical protein FOA52_013859 [Chlamydomonas sp. UWO 241]